MCVTHQGLKRFVHSYSEGFLECESVGNYCYFLEFVLHIIRMIKIVGLQKIRG